MSKLNARLSDLTTRLQSAKPSASIQENLESAHARLSTALRTRQRNGRLREVTEDALRALAKSLELDSWTDEASDGVRILSITGKIIVVDLAFDAETSQFKSCTLVLATEDGLQDEIVVDGRDIMTQQLLKNQLDAFSASLEKLAFLDKYSEQGLDLNLFNVQDILREAVNRKLALCSDVVFSPTSSTSHLDLCFTYHQAQPLMQKADEHDVKPAVTTGTVFKAHLEIELQPVSAQMHSGPENGGASAESSKKPVLRYPRTWIDGSKSWLPSKQFKLAKFRDDLRYVMILEPEVLMPLVLVKNMVGQSLSRLEYETRKKSRKHERLVHTPTGPQRCISSISVTEEMAVVRKIAFSHPKELEVILSHARQYAICQHLVSSLHSNASAIRHQQSHEASAITNWHIEREFVKDSITAIDDRQAIQLSFYLEEDRQHAIATVQILPDYTLKCWHSIDAQFFERAMRLTSDLPIAMIATALRSPKSASPVEKSLPNTDSLVCMDFRRDPKDESTRKMTSSEAKQGYNYTIPVDSQIEMKTTSALPIGSPTYLVQLGKSLRNAPDNA